MELEYWLMMLLRKEYWCCCWRGNYHWSIFRKKTMGYQRYLAAVPKKTRKIKDEKHPMTPNLKQKCSKRSWDGQVKVWRLEVEWFLLLSNSVSLDVDYIIGILKIWTKSQKERRMWIHWLNREISTKKRYLFTFDLCLCVIVLLLNHSSNITSTSSAPLYLVMLQKVVNWRDW